MIRVGIRKQELLGALGRQISKTKENRHLTAVIDRPEDIFYYTHFWGEGILIIKENEESKLIVPRLEYLRAVNSSKECNIISSERGRGLIDSILKFLGSNDIVCYGGNDYWMANIIAKQVGKRNLILGEDLVKKD